MDFLKAIQNYKDDLVLDLVKILQMNTIAVEQLDNKDAPFGENLKEALIKVLDLGESFGFKTKNIDNVAGHIEYGEGKEIIAILCHLDVVPTGEDWTYPPFSGTVLGDKIYARGALDDKGPLMSSLYALKLLKDLEIKLNKRVRLIIGTDEESGSRGIKRYLEVEEQPNMGFSPDANFPLIYGEKGIMSIDIIDKQREDKFTLTSGDRYNIVPDQAVFTSRTDIKDEFIKNNEDHQLKHKIENNKYYLYGRSSHAMEPEKGINAFVNLAIFLKNHFDNHLIKFVGDKLIDTRFTKINENFTDKEMGDLTVNVANAIIGEDGGKVGLNLRYPINWDKDGFIARFSALANTNGLEIKVISDSKPHYVNPNSHFIKTLHNAYIKYTNDKTSPLQTIGGGTYAREIKNAVAFGMLMPGRDDVVHRVDEYVHISDLLKAAAIYAEAVYQLGK